MSVLVLSIRQTSLDWLHGIPFDSTGGGTSILFASGSNKGIVLNDVLSLENKKESKKYKSLQFVCLFVCLWAGWLVC